MILVVLIFGFVSGWKGIKDWLAPSGNVGKVVSECRVACASNSEYGVCEEKRRVVFEDGKEVSFSCFTLWYLLWELGFEFCGDVVCGDLDCEEDLLGVWKEAEKVEGQDSEGREKYTSNCWDVETEIEEMSGFDRGDREMWVFSDVQIKLVSMGRSKEVAGGDSSGKWNIDRVGRDVSEVCCYFEPGGLN